MLVSHPPRPMQDMPPSQGSSSPNAVNAQAGPSRPTSVLGLGISRDKEPQEQWDDDFLFQQVSTTSPTRKNGSHTRRPKGHGPVPSFNEAGWMDTDDDEPTPPPPRTQQTTPDGDDEVDMSRSPSARKKAKKDWHDFDDDDDDMGGMDGILTPQSKAPRAPSPPPQRPASRTPTSRQQNDGEIISGLPPSTSYDSTLSEQAFVQPERHSYYNAPHPFPSPSATATDFMPSSPTQTYLSDAQRQSSVHTLEESYNDVTPKSARTRRRLRKRSRAGENPLGDGSSDEDDEFDGTPGRRSERESPDEGRGVGGATSPRQFLARGMNSIQKRLSSTSRPRPPSETPPPPSQSPRKLHKSPSIEQQRPRRISIPLRESVNPDNSADDSTVTTTSNASPHLARSPSGGSPFQRAGSAVMGFHLPSRSNSALSSPKVKPKVIVKQPSSVLMPPPPIPDPTMRQRPRSVVQTSARQVTPVQHPNNPPMSDVSQLSHGSPVPVDLKLIKPTGLRRLSSLGRKSHRATASVSSIPTNKTSPPSRSNTPLPTLAASPLISESATMAAPYSTDIVRSTSSPSVHGPTRRNSLSDLRIPSRVASAQKALRERVGVVREFALKVEDLKALQHNYVALRETLVNSFAAQQASFPPLPPQMPAQPQSSSRPSFSICRESIDHFRSNQNAQALREIELSYSPWWEMAEVLVELGGGTVVDQETKEAHRISEAGSTYSARERAITMAGGIEPPSTSNGRITPSEQLSAPLLSGGGTHAGPPQASPERWRASTGRSDLSKRQLDVLRGMLTTPASPTPLPPLPQIPRNGKPYPNIAGRSGVNLPSSATEVSFCQPSGSYPSSRTLNADEQDKKSKLSARRASRAGVKGIKDFLRSLRLGGDMPPDDEDMTMGSDGKRSVSDPVARRVSGGVGTMSTLATGDQSFGSTATRKSPRRPSLASIFRFSSNGDRSRTSTRSGSGKSQASGSRTDVDNHNPTLTQLSSHGSDADWERMSIDEAGPAMSNADFGGRTTPGSISSHQSRMVDDRTVRSTSSSAAAAKAMRRLSPAPPLPPMPQPPPTRSSPLPMRSAPPSAQRPADWPATSPVANGPGGGSARQRENEGVVELSPENLKPLLEHVKEVEKRCGECLVEMRMLGR